MVLPSHTRSRAKHAREPIPNDSRYVQYRVLLGLEKQDCAVSEIEVDEVFRLCLRLSIYARYASKLKNPSLFLPCVTKLPKFLPTTQCHVAPLR